MSHSAFPTATSRELTALRATDDWRSERCGDQDTSRWHCCATPAVFPPAIHVNNELAESFDVIPRLRSEIHLGFTMLSSSLISQISLQKVQHVKTS